MSVHRTRPLPKGLARGHLIVCELAAEETRHLLRCRRRRREERLALWLGRNVEADTIVVSTHAPTTRSTASGVFFDEAALGAASTAARAQRLGVVAQVHSHPGRDTRHSDGDDQLVLMPYEGMFSLVVGEYGRGGLLPEQGAGLHQYQDGRWVQIVQAEPAILIVPGRLT